MKKRNKVVLGISVLSLVLLVTAIPSFASHVEQKASGGWDESEGYYINSTNENGLGILKHGTVPEEHHGERRTRIVDSGGTPEVAAYGYTVWTNTYHYTTAQMEKRDGTVLTTSGREWGTGGTTAHSPWYGSDLFERPKARTYWGH